MLPREVAATLLLVVVLWGAQGRTSRHTAVSIVCLVFIAGLLRPSQEREGVVGSGDGSGADPSPDASEIQRINKHNMGVLNSDLEPLIELQRMVHDISGNAATNRRMITSIGDQAKADSAELVGHPTKKEEAELDPR